MLPYHYLIALVVIVVYQLINRMSQPQQNLLLVQNKPQDDKPQDPPSQATQSVVANCFAYAGPYQAARRVDILSDENLAKFIGVAYPSQQCRSYLKILKGTYKDRPLFKKALRIILGTYPNTTFSFVPELIERSGNRALGQFFHYSQSIVLANLTSPENFIVKDIYDLCENPTNVARHELVHALFYAYNEKNDYALITTEFVQTVLSKHAEYVNDIKNLKSLCDKADKNFSALSAAQNQTLERYDRFAFKGMLPETQHLNPLRFVIMSHEVLDEQIVRFGKDRTRAEEIFTYLFQMFSEEHIRDFFPFFYEKMQTIVASFDNAPLQLHNGVFPDPKVYRLDYIEAERVKGVERDSQERDKELQKDLPLLASQLSAYHQAMISSVFRQDEAMIKQMMKYFSQDNVLFIAGHLSDKDDAILQHTLAIGHVYLKDPAAACKCLNQAAQKDPDSFKEADLYLFKQVSQESGIPIYGQEMRRKIAQLEKQDTHKKFKRL